MSELGTSNVTSDPGTQRTPQMTWEQAVAWLREQPDQRQLVLDSYFDDPVSAAAQRFERSPEWIATRALLPAADGRALDLGAGRGVASFALAKLGFQVVALEPDDSALVGTGAIAQLSRETGTQIELCQQRGEKLPFPDASFALVYCRQALHHAADLPTLCREIGRVLRPGGRFLAVREHVVSRRSDVPDFQRSHPLHRFYGGENAYTLSEYRSALRGAGLRVDLELNPFQSPINYSPTTEEEFRARARRKLRLPLMPDAVVDLALWAKGALDRTPGRLYSFVGHRPS